MGTSNTSPTLTLPTYLFEIFVVLEEMLNLGEEQLLTSSGGKCFIDWQNLVLWNGQQLGILLRLRLPFLACR